MPIMQSDEPPPEHAYKLRDVEDNEQKQSCSEHFTTCACVQTQGSDRRELLYVCIRGGP
jgi:hypothetical protein